MVFVLIGDAKPGVSLEQIRANRRAYVDWERSSPYAGKYQTIARYEVVGASPKKTFWIMQTDDPAMIHGVVEFFADLWNIQTFPVVQRGIGEAG
jgi:hypothetical protein